MSQTQIGDVARKRSVRTLAVLAAMVVSMLAMDAPAWAGAVPTYNLSADITHGAPGAAITLSGSPSAGTSPCPNVAYTITGYFPIGGGMDSTQVLSGTTDGSGNFSKSTQIPSNAEPGGVITYLARITCSTGQRQSNTLGVTIDQPPTPSYVLSASLTHGPPRAPITLTGTKQGGGSCSNASYTITGTYPRRKHGTGTRTIDGIADSTGDFSWATRIPANAKPGATVSYSATIQCGKFGQLNTNTVSVTVDSPNSTLANWLSWLMSRLRPW